MGNKRVLALRKQLKREQLHVLWLEQHLPHSPQLNSAQQRVAKLCVLEDAFRCIITIEKYSTFQKNGEPLKISIYQ